MLGIEGSTFTVDGIDRGTYGGKSLVLDGSADYLSQTLGTPTDNNVFTYSVWVKRSTLGSEGLLFEGYATDTNNRTTFLFDDTTNTLRFLHLDGGSVTDDVITSAVYRDTHAFMHIVLAVNTDEATASDRVKIYVDGIQETAFGTTNYPASGQAYDMNSATTHTIGIGAALNTSTCFHGYYAKIDFIDGLQLTPASFGHTSADTGKWVASNTSGLTFGANGFSLDFNDDRSGTPDTTTTIYDQSSNSNNWTGNSLVTGSFTSDVPNNSYATLNPLNMTTAGMSEGNTRHDYASPGGNDEAFLTMSVDVEDSDGYYVEWGTGANVGNSCSACFVIWDSGKAVPMDVTGGQLTLSHADADAGVVISSRGAGGSNKWDIRTMANGAGAPVENLTVAWVSTDRWALFIRDGKVWLRKNGSWIDDTASETGVNSPDTDDTGAIITGLSGQAWFGCQESSSGSQNFQIQIGSDKWNYTAPTGAKQISSANLPVPDALYRKPQNFADILLYTGDGVAIGSGGNAVTGAAFTPDLTWIKNRDAADSHQWTDIVRGVTKNISSDSTAVEGTDTEGLTSFTSGGFTVGSDVSYNTNAEDYWAMCLKADNTSGSSNTDGSITSTVAAGDFFSIVTYTGTGANATVGHGLGKVPDMIIVKRRTGNTDNFYVYHSSNTSAPETDHLFLNLTNATTDSATHWNDTAPTSSVFSLGAEPAVNANTNTYVAYCFVFDTTDSRSPFCGGSFEGNANVDGPVVVCDELIYYCAKNIDAAWGWVMWDAIRSPYNPADRELFIHTSAAEYQNAVANIDFVSNGMKYRTANSTENSANTHIWWGIKKNGGQLWA